MQQKLQVDYNKLKYICDLEYFDGPLLMEYRDENNNCYLLSWCDFVKNEVKHTNILDEHDESIASQIILGYSIFCVYNVTEENLNAYLTNKISMRNLYLNSKNEIVDIVIIKNGKSNTFCNENEINKHKFEILNQISKRELLENENIPNSNCYRYLPSDSAFYDPSLTPGTPLLK